MMKNKRTFRDTALLLIACWLTIGSAYAVKKESMPLPGVLFDIDGNTAFLILPENATPGKPIPWVWYAPTLGKHPDSTEAWMFQQFVDKGIAIAGVDVGESQGNPAGRAVYSKLYKELTEKRGLAKKPAMLARSRGGLMLYNWAAENPTSVSCIAGIYPVCNLASYPGMKGASKAYGMTEKQLAEVLSQHNPIDRLASLAKAKIPIYHAQGDNDRVVPLEKNSAIMKERYDELGGNMTLEIIKGGGHDMAAAWFHNQALVNFIIKHVTAG